jgi:GGDEF domain-containing protein
MATGGRDTSWPMLHGPPRRRRARPVADAPIDALLMRAEDLAKGWLFALLEQAPLREAPAILAGELSRDGPRLCDAVVRALADDGDLHRIEAGGVLEPLVAQAGAVGGGAGVSAASQAVDALHAVIWSALRSELADPDGEQVSDLAERLTLVIEHVRGAALRAFSNVAASEPQAAPGPMPPMPLAQQDQVAERRGSLHVAPPPPDMPSFPTSPMTPPTAEVGIDALWKGALDDEVDRAAHSGAPLSLLIVELADADRVVSVEGRPGAGVTLGRFARAVRSAVRRGDILACESDTRAWIIATNTGRLGAQALADRVAAAVRAAEPWRGAPLGVNAGIAVFREDGGDVAELIDAAEEARFAAEASGVVVIRDGALAGSQLEPEADPAV